MKIEVYTDGSCKPSNPGPAGFGYIILVDGKVSSTGSGSLGWATNNIAEVRAIEYSLKALKQAGFCSEEIEIYSDSQYAIGLFSKNWKAKANIELIRKVREDLKEFPKIIFTWVKAHNGNLHNEAVDDLAKNAADSNEDKK